MCDRIPHPTNMRIKTVAPYLEWLRVKTNKLGVSDTSCLGIKDVAQCCQSRQQYEITIIINMVPTSCLAPRMWVWGFGSALLCIA
jgi:hypothetical protein